MNTVPSPKKAAFVTLLGRPSSGKSTLVNQLCGEQVAIVSPVPQTTRNAIRGIVNHNLGQLVLIDTPGVHQSEKKFNRHLTDTAFRAASESDLILYVLDASRAPGPEEEAIADRCRSLVLETETQIPLVVAVNKIDLSSADIDRAVKFINGRFTAMEENRIIPISAQKNEGIDKLLSILFELASPGEAFYPEDYYTDQEMDFRIAEIIRGAAIRFLHQELPHSIYVEVADRELHSPEKNNGADDKILHTQHTLRLWIRAFIICERESQKGMIVGKGGKTIKAIGEISRKELNRIFDWKVDLDLRVKTGKDWRHNDRILQKLLDR
ncbi:MAG: GTPase Era [Treponema sp.]|nr:GTPase Era [Treponema sp.]